MSIQVLCRMIYATGLVWEADCRARSQIEPDPAVGGDICYEKAHRFDLPPSRRPGSICAGKPVLLCLSDESESGLLRCSHSLLSRPVSRPEEKPLPASLRATRIRALHRLCRPALLEYRRPQHPS